MLTTFTTGVTTNCSTTLDKEMLEPTRKDTLHPRTKEKLCQDSESTATETKSLPYPPSGQPIDQGITVPQSFSKGSASSKPYNSLSRLGRGVGNRRRSSPPESLVLRAGRI